MRWVLLAISALLWVPFALAAAPPPQSHGVATFPDAPYPMFLSRLQGSVAGQPNVLLVSNATPTATGMNAAATQTFVAPGVHVLGLVNTPADQHWYFDTPWPKDLEITTSPSVVLYFSANAQATTVFEVRIYDVHPDGSVEQIAANIQQFVTALDPTPVTFFLSDLQGKVLREGDFLRVSLYAQTGNAAIILSYDSATAPSGVVGLRARWLDFDGDGVSDSDERREATNPLDPLSFKNTPFRDSDNDGLSDEFERGIGSDASKVDTDGDGFGDGIEVYAGTDPLRAASHPQDSNGNGLPDSFETNYYNSTTVNNNGAPIDPHGDPDSDGCDNLCEASHGTDPNVADTDHDGVRDGAEIAAGTDPLVPPGMNADSDHDGLSDALERDIGTNPAKADTDNDGFSDGVEFFANTDPKDHASFPADRNKNGLPDTFEYKYFNSTIVNNHGINGTDDPDRDGCDNLCEAAHGTDPTIPDTDGDGVNDGDEVNHQTDPRTPGSAPVIKAVRDRLEMQYGAVMFAAISVLALFGTFGRNLK